MNYYSGSFLEALSSYRYNRNLLFILTKREIVSRYRGSLIGGLWTVITPLLMLSVYTFVFGDILQVKWGDGDKSANFSLMLFVGLIMFSVITDCFIRAPSVIVSNANYVNKVVFPLEIIPLSLLFSALFNAAVGFIILLLFSLFLKVPIYSGVFMVPIIIVPYIIFVLGVVYLLSSLGVFLRDLGQLIGLVCTALMFLSPIFYPASNLPEEYQTIVKFNPLTYPIEEIRNVMFHNSSVSWDFWLGYFIIAMIIFLIGFFVFQKIRKGFADVL